MSGQSQNVQTSDFFIQQEMRRRAEAKEGFRKLQESLDDLRLSVKYLVFDLEATRRENAYLRRMLAECDERGGHGTEDS